MSTRRRTYSLLGCWLMSGEVLYCGAPNSNYTYGSTSNKAFQLSKDYSQLDGLSIFIMFNYIHSANRHTIMMNFYKEDLTLDSKGYYWLGLNKCSVSHSESNPVFVSSSNLYLSSDGKLSFSTDSKYVYDSDRITVIAIPRTDI